jgi:hypothetical protein
MLSPRLTDCPECANIPSLLKKIDCKLAELGNNLYNNISYMLNKPVPSSDILQLIAYRRILTYKYCNPNYVHEYSVQMIASRVIRLTVGCVSRCNEPERCLEDPCDITIVPNPTTTSTSTLPTTTTTSTSSTTSTTTTVVPTTTTTSSSSTSTTTSTSSTSTSTTSTSTTAVPTTTTTSSSSTSTTTSSSSSTTTTTSSSTSTTTTTTTAATYALCQLALGGRIAYILQPGDPGYDAGVQHGLVAALTDVATGLGATWGCFGTLISGADGTAIGTGNQNTNDILAGCPTVGIAAELCSSFVSGGYTDWYLPSKDELNKLYLNKACLSFVNTDYVSSSEVDANNAWRQNFTIGTVTTVSKNGGCYVRPIRSF